MKSAQTLVAAVLCAAVLATRAAEPEHDVHFAELQAMLVDSKHEQLAAEAAAAGYQANAHKLEMNVIRLQARVAFLEGASGSTGVEIQSTTEQSRDERVERLERLVLELAESVNVTHKKNLELEADRDRAWSRALQAEANAAKLHAFEGTLNATVERLETTVASQQAHINNIDAVSLLKNQALAAGAKRTAWLQEKLTRLAGEMHRATAVFEKHAHVQEVAMIRNSMQSWFAETKEASVFAAMQTANASTAVLELKLTEAEQNLNTKGKYADSLRDTVLQSADSLRLLSLKFEELTNSHAHSPAEYQQAVLDALEESNRQYTALSEAKDEVLQLSKDNAASNAERLAGRWEDNARLSKAMHSTAEATSSSLVVAAERFAELQDKLRLLAGTLSTCDVQLKEYQEEAERAQNWADVHALNASKIAAEERLAKLEFAYAEMRTVLAQAEQHSDCAIAGLSKLPDLANLGDISLPAPVSNASPSPPAPPKAETPKRLASALEYITHHRRGGRAAPVPAVADPDVAAPADSTPAAPAEPAAEAAGELPRTTQSPASAAAGGLSLWAIAGVLAVLVGGVLALRRPRAPEGSEQEEDPSLAGKDDTPATPPSSKRTPKPLPKIKRVSFHES